MADALTGLPNRLLFIDRLGRLIEHAKRHKEYLSAVLFLDLDGFKMINDSFGHVAGAELLVAVADRLRKCLRTSDTITRLVDFTIARLGGDEFAVLLDHIEDPKDASLIAERFIKSLTLPFTLAGKEVFTSMSVGIALSSIGYQQPEDLLRDADTAMYRAKSMGKARCEVFDADMRASVVARLQLETDLRRAVERKEFRNVYQPVVSLDSGRVAGFEALLRRQHPTRGLLQPEKMLLDIKSLGIQLSIDDFGTGYSSLSYLHHFPFDTLKIDGSFTKAMGEAGGSMEIVRTILPMAKNLRLDAIAEGVETIEQIAKLRELRCEYAQGYYFSKPVTAIEAGVLLEQQQGGNRFDVARSGKGSGHSALVSLGDSIQETSSRR